MRVLIKRKDYIGSEKSPSRNPTVEGPYSVTWDTSARRLIDAALDVPVRVNLDGAAIIEDVTLTIFSETIETDFISDFYEYRLIEVFGSADDLLFSGVITEVTMDESKGTVRLVCRSTISRFMSAPCVYSNISQNPVEAVKTMIENAGGVVDSASYTRIFNQLEGDYIRAAFSYTANDGLGTLDAVEKICDLFGFCIYQEAGTFYFWANDSYRNEISLSLNDVGNLKLDMIAAKFNQLSVTWELGSTVRVLSSSNNLYGVIDSTLDLTRPGNIVAYDLGTIDDGIVRMFVYKANRRRFLSFVSTRNLDLRERYSLEKETASFEFQIIEKSLTPSGMYQYRALMVGVTW